LKTASERRPGSKKCPKDEGQRGGQIGGQRGSQSMIYESVKDFRKNPKINLIIKNLLKAFAEN